MSELRRHVDDYLRLRRSFGYKLEEPERILACFVAYLEAAGATTVRTDLAIEWAQLPQGVDPLHWAHRLSAIRGFARYLQTIDPAAEVPPTGVFPCGQRRRSPYLWSAADIARVLAAFRTLRSPVLAATYATAWGLLSVTGMRVGEALRLRRGDANLADGILTVNSVKGIRTRLLPLHPTTTEALRTYARQRDQLITTTSDTFFVSSIGTAANYAGLLKTFNEITAELGLRSDTVRPRIHDVRHSFALRTLIDWHVAGIDIDTQMAVLSAYLGHTSAAGTYYYLSASPELMQLAARRLDQRGRP